MTFKGVPGGDGVHGRSREVNHGSTDCHPDVSLESCPRGGTLTPERVADLRRGRLSPGQFLGRRKPLEVPHPLLLPLGVTDSWATHGPCLTYDIMEDIGNVLKRIDTVRSSISSVSIRVFRPYERW